jgi:hypothetical protein
MGESQYPHQAGPLKEQVLDGLWPSMPVMGSQVLLPSLWATPLQQPLQEPGQVEPGDGLVSIHVFLSFPAWAPTEEGKVGIPGGGFGVGGTVPVPGTPVLCAVVMPAEALKTTKADRKPSLAQGRAPRSSKGSDGWMDGQPGNQGVPPTGSSFHPLTLGVPHPSFHLLFFLF